MSEVNTFVLSDLATLPVLLKLSRAGSVEQRQSVGFGLGRAVAYCASRDSDIGRRIREGVRSLGDRDVAFGFRLAQQGMDKEPVGGGGLQLGNSGSLPMLGEPNTGSGSMGTRLNPDSRLDARDFDLPSLKVR